MILRPFKKIKEQEKRIEELLEEIDSYKRKEEWIQKKEKSERHNVGIWCNGCKNLMKEKSYSPFSREYENKFCKLDCKCEDRKENE